MKCLPYILIAVLAFGLGWYSRSPTKNNAGKADTITSVSVVTKVDVDTLYLFSPIPYLVRVDNTDTITTDSCRHLREYREYQDSNYYAKISGISPRLDEIRIYPKTVYQREYIYRDILRKRGSGRWGIGFSAGYGLSKSGFSPVFAVTVNYNLWNF